MERQEYVALEAAAERLGVSREVLYGLVRRTGAPGTVRTADGRWFLTEDGIAQLRRTLPS